MMKRGEGKSRWIGIGMLNTRVVVMIFTERDEDGSTALNRGHAVGRVCYPTSGWRIANPPYI